MQKMRKNGKRNLSWACSMSKLNNIFDAAKFSIVNFSFADLRSAKFGFANIRLAALAAISLSLTLAGCDTGGGGRKLWR